MDQVPISSKFDSAYLLPHDEKERHRLEVQHELYKKTLYDGRLIFDENVRLQSGDKVLDIGAGTGIWAVQLAQEASEDISIDAADLNPTLFSSQHQPNITLTISSVTNLPEEWSDRFAFVHQRLLMAALRVSEWPIAISEIYRVLKHGGSVQLVEAVSPWNPKSEASEKLRRLIIATFKENDLLINCAREIPKLLEAAGFVNIHSKETAIMIGAAAGEDGVAGKLAFLDAFRGMIPSMRRANGFGIVQSDKEIDDIFDTLSVEWDREPVEFFMKLIYAQKP